MKFTVVRQAINESIALPKEDIELDIINEYSSNLANIEDGGYAVIHNFKVGLLYNNQELFYFRVHKSFLIDTEWSLEKANESFTNQIENTHINLESLMEDELRASKYWNMYLNLFKDHIDFSSLSQQTLEECTLNGLDFD